MTDLEYAREFFQGDRYAADTTGIVIEEVREGYARVSLKAGKEHSNASGVVMGGALFTMADFAFAAAANYRRPLTVTQESSVIFLRPVRPGNLTAVCRCIKDGRRTCTFEIEVFDKDQKLSAKVTSIGIHVSEWDKEKPVPGDDPYALVRR